MDIRASVKISGEIIFIITERLRKLLKLIKRQKII